MSRVEKTMSVSTGGGARSSAAPPSSSSATMACPTFAALYQSTDRLSDFEAMSSFNLKHNLRKKENTSGPMHDFAHFELGRAATSSENQLVAVATDCPQAQYHFLAIIDPDRICAARAGDPVASYLRVNQHVSDVRWIDGRLLLTACGRGDLELLQWDSHAQTIDVRGRFNGVCASYIREMALRPGSSAEVVLGGFDGKLNFIDLNRPDTLYTQRLDLQSVVSSVKWAPFQAAAHVSCCLDEGKFYLFDTRSKIAKPSFLFDTRKEDCYTHERYNEFAVLLGYGDGEMKHLDLRMANTVLHTVRDPYVEAIGNIDWDVQAQAFLVSGYTDFTVWKLADDVPVVHSHSSIGRSSKTCVGHECKAVWLGINTILSTDNAGDVALYSQDW